MYGKVMEKTESDNVQLIKKWKTKKTHEKNITQLNSEVNWLYCCCAIEIMISKIH